MTSPIFVIIFSTTLRTHKNWILIPKFEVTSWVRPYCPTKAKINDAWFLKFQYKVSFLDDLEGFLECLGLKKIEFWWNLMVVWYLYGEKKKDEPGQLHLHFPSNHISEALNAVGIYLLIKKNCGFLLFLFFFLFWWTGERHYFRYLLDIHTNLVILLSY